MMACVGFIVVCLILYFIDGPFVDLLQFAFASFASYFVSIFALEFCPKVGQRCGGTLAVVFFVYYSF